MTETAKTPNPLKQARREKRDAEVRRAALEEAAQAVCRAAWKHEGHDEYSRGLDRGAVTQNEQDYLAIRALIDAPPTSHDATGKEVMPDASTRPIQQPDTSPRLTAGAHHTCTTDGCTNPPAIWLDDRHLCRGCYAAP